MITDEDIAEKWLNERYLSDMGIRKPCKDAFLAGLKAGRTNNKSDTDKRTYKDGFQDAVNMILDKLKEAHLKEVESQFLSILDGLSSWKSCPKEGGLS